MDECVNNVIVTTIEDANAQLIDKGKQYARELGTLFVLRNNHSLQALKQQFNVDNIITASKSGPIVHTPQGKYFFHLSMAPFRIKNYHAGNPDHMVRAMNLQTGMSVLDCTLGLATDAIIASYVTGPTGQVIGLEASPIIALVAKEGLVSYTTNDKMLDSAMRRIQVITSHHLTDLKTLPDKSFDIVYFDPMFRHPNYASCNLRPVRGLVDNNQLALEAINEAKRIARHRVVVKENQYSAEFNRLRITAFYGGKYSRVKYGVIEVAPHG